MCSTGFVLSSSPKSTKSQSCRVPDSSSATWRIACKSIMKLWNAALKSPPCRGVPQDWEGATESLEPTDRWRGGHFLAALPAWALSMWNTGLLQLPAADSCSFPGLAGGSEPSKDFSGGFQKLWRCQSAPPASVNSSLTRHLGPGANLGSSSESSQDQPVPLIADPGPPERTLIGLNASSV